MPTLKWPYMLEEYEKKRQKQESFMRSLRNYAMGVFILALGGLLFFHDKLKIRVNESFSTDTVKILGGIFMAYGIWRIYRGYKKNYFQ